MDVQRMIQQVFITQLRAHPLTFATAREMYRDGDTALTVVVCWWMAFKFEETGMTLTVDDLKSTFPAIVHGVNYSVNLRNAERMVLARINFCMPYATRMREIYDILPMHSAEKYHVWLVTLQDYRVIHMFSAADWVQLLIPVLQRTSMPPTLQCLAYTFLRRHRRRLFKVTPRIGLRRAYPTLVTIGVRKRCHRIFSIRIIDPFK